MTKVNQVLEFEVTAEGVTVEDIWKCDPTAPEPSGMDGASWADSFCKMFPRCGVSQGLMETWFCNAIMAGYDEGWRRSRLPASADPQRKEGV